MPNSKLRLALVTTARSDYSTMYPVMALASRDPDVDAKIICGGMHLRPEFGETWRQLAEDGLEIAEKVDFFVPGDAADSWAKSLALGTAAFADALIRVAPDFVVVSGDRLENLALYSAATALRLPIAHMCGGDVTEGALDNQVRHAMTKLSHLHFVSMDEHAARVLQMGEEPWRIVITGDAAIDTITAFQPPSREHAAKKLDLPKEGELAACTFHPATLGNEDSECQFANILEALAELPVVPILTYPNFDPGHDPLVKHLERFRERRPDALVRHSFRREEYYALLSHCSFMIGNSSSGIWEAPSFGLPAVNVGGRQAGRLRARNVIDVSGNDLNEIKAAIHKARSREFKTTLNGLANPYGAGRASQATINVLKSTPRDERLFVKKFYELHPDLSKLPILRA